MQILEDIAKVGQPWCAEDDADVGAHVHPKGIYLERLGIDVEQDVEAGFPVGNLVATANEDHSVDASLREAG